ncbi:MAG: hypothetical protein JXJ22_12445 [Bacteroidales bacterium]|nr:hypothetical protein [Bacteroidales bacterium]
MRIFSALVSLFFLQNITCQQTPINTVSEMTWKLDYEIYLELSNDSSYTFDIRQLFHITENKNNFSTDYIYYPANLGKDFISDVESRNSNTPYDPSGSKTLWSALHGTLGGGWVHFTNCMMYALETGNLNPTAPLMKRPESKWKPNPVTETYLRTKKWKYYVPVSQKDAHKEYQIRAKQNLLGDLTSFPSEYTELFLKTKNKEYNKLKDAGQNNTTARIDLIKILLGANYLGEAQISYIRSAVLKAVKNYSINKLPSVIIFDEYDAAVVLALDTQGYTIENVIFKASANISETEAKKRTSQIYSIIKTINEYNQNTFRKQLGNYYK